MPGSEPENGFSGEFIGDVIDRPYSTTLMRSGSPKYGQTWNVTRFYTGFSLRHIRKPHSIKALVNFRKESRDEEAGWFNPYDKHFFGVARM